MIGVTESGASADFFFERVLTKTSQIATGGYIYSNFPKLDGSSAFERVIFLPETFFINLEMAVVNNLGERGKNKLYGIGKAFGYRFASLLSLPREDVRGSVSSIFRFLETLYAEKINVTLLDEKKKVLTLYTEDLAITSKDKMGYILTVGGCAGIWCYLIKDYAIECSINIISESEIELVCAPISELKSKKLEILKSRSVAPIELDNILYKQQNMPDKSSQDRSLFSMSKLIDAGLVNYHQGKMSLTFSDTRLLPVEISLLSEIESNIETELVLESAQKCFFDIGCRLEKQPDPEEYIAQLLTAFGFGIVEVINSSEGGIVFNFRGYPFISQLKLRLYFAVVKGIILGFCSSCGKEYKVNSSYTKELSNSLIVSLDVIPV